MAPPLRRVPLVGSVVEGAGPRPHPTLPARTRQARRTNNPNNLAPPFPPTTPGQDPLRLAGRAAPTRRVRVALAARLPVSGRRVREPRAHRRPSLAPGGVTLSAGVGHGGQVRGHELRVPALPSPGQSVVVEDLVSLGDVHHLPVPDERGEQLGRCLAASTPRMLPHDCPTRCTCCWANRARSNRWPRSRRSQRWRGCG